MDANFTPLWLRLLSLTFCSIFTWTNVLFAQRANPGFWEERRNVVAQFTGGKALEAKHSRPLGLSSFRIERRLKTPDKSGNYNLLAQFPALQPHLPFSQPQMQAQNDKLQIPNSKQISNTKISNSKQPNKPNDFSELILPYAEIKEIFVPSAIRNLQSTIHDDSITPCVVIIQDVHQHYEAQKNIANIIESIVNETVGGRSETKQLPSSIPHLPSTVSPVVIGVEGGIGLFNFSPYRIYSDKQLTKDIADFFMRQGMIGGPEFYGITAPEKSHVNMVGVEDEKLYLANIQAFKESLPLEKQVKAKVEVEKKQVKDRKNKIFNKELLEIGAKREQYHEGKLNIGDYLTALSRFPSPSNFLTSTLILTYPSVCFLVEAYNIEKSLDISKLEFERSQILDILTEKLPQPTLNELLGSALAYKTGSISYARFYSYFKEAAKSAGINFPQFHEMDKYARYVQLADSIDKNKLFTEIEQLETSIENTLAKTKEEKELLKESKCLELVKKLVDFSLTPEEWKQYLLLRDNVVARFTGGEALSSFRIGRRLKHSTTTTPDKSGNYERKELNELSLLPFEQFYETALKRNEVLVSNLLTSTLTLTYVLIAGGFHTNGITEILQQKNIPYIVLTPNVTKVEEGQTPDSGTRGQASLEVLARGKTSLEKLFASEKIFLSAPRSAGNPIPGYPNLVKGAFNILYLGLARNSHQAIEESKKSGSNNNIIQSTDSNFGLFQVRELEVKQRRTGKVFRFLVPTMANSKKNLVQNMRSYQKHVMTRSKELLAFTIGNKTGALRLVVESFIISSIVSALLHFTGITGFHLALAITTPLISVSLIPRPFRSKLRFEWMRISFPGLTPATVDGSSSIMREIFTIPIPNFQSASAADTEGNGSHTSSGKDESSTDKSEKQTYWGAKQITSFEKALQATMHEVNNIAKTTVSGILRELLSDRTGEYISDLKLRQETAFEPLRQIEDFLELLFHSLELGKRAFELMTTTLSEDQLKGIFAEANGILVKFIAASNELVTNVQNIHQETADMVAELLHLAQHRIRAFIEKKGQFDTTGTPESIDVNASINKTLIYYRRRFKDALNIVFKPQEQLSPVIIDGILLFEVWSNIITNAAEAATQKPTSVNIKTKQEGSMIQIDITDEGPGIPHENLPIIFEQGFSAKANHGKYRGIGLYLVKQIIENAGGSISVASNVGQGTTFTIHFPIQSKAENNPTALALTIEDSAKTPESEKLGTKPKTNAANLGIFLFLAFMFWATHHAFGNERQVFLAHIEQTKQQSLLKLDTAIKNRIIPSDNATLLRERIITNFSQLSDKVHNLSKQGSMTEHIAVLQSEFKVYLDQFYRDYQASLIQFRGPKQRVLLRDTILPLIFGIGFFLFNFYLGFRQLKKYLVEIEQKSVTGKLKPVLTISIAITLLVTLFDQTSQIFLLNKHPLQYVFRPVIDVSLSKHISILITMLSFGIIAWIFTILAHKQKWSRQIWLTLTLGILLATAGGFSNAISVNIRGHVADWIPLIFDPTNPATLADVIYIGGYILAVLTIVFGASMLADKLIEFGRHPYLTYRSILKWLGLGVAAWFMLTTGQTIIGGTWANQINESALEKQIRIELEKHMPETKTNFLDFLEQPEKMTAVPDNQKNLFNALRLIYLAHILDEESYTNRNTTSIQISVVELPRMIHYMAGEELASMVKIINDKPASFDNETFTVLLEKVFRIHSALNVTPKIYGDEPEMTFGKVISAFKGLIRFIAPGIELREKQINILRQVQDYGARQAGSLAYGELLETEQFIKNDVSRFLIRLFDVSVFTKDTLIQMWTNIRLANDIMNKNSKKRIVIGLITDDDNIASEEFHERFKKDFKQQIREHFGIKDDEIERMLSNVEFGRITITGSELGKENQMTNSKIEMDPDLIYKLALKKSKSIFGDLPENYPLSIQIFTPNPFRFDLAWENEALQILTMVSAVQIVKIDRQADDTLRQLRQKLSQA